MLEAGHIIQHILVIVYDLNAALMLISGVPRLKRAASLRINCLLDQN